MKPFPGDDGYIENDKVSSDHVPLKMGLSLVINQELGGSTDDDSAVKEQSRETGIGMPKLQSQADAPAEAKAHEKEQQRMDELVSFTSSSESVNAARLPPFRSGAAPPTAVSTDVYAAMNENIYALLARRHLMRHRLQLLQSQCAPLGMLHAAEGPHTPHHNMTSTLAQAMLGQHELDKHIRTPCLIGDSGETALLGSAVPPVPNAAPQEDSCSYKTEHTLGPETSQPKRVRKWTPPSSPSAKAPKRVKLNGDTEISSTPGDDPSVPRFRNYQTDQWSEKFQELLDFKKETGHV